MRTIRSVMAICNSAARRPRSVAIASRLSSIHQTRTQGTGFRSWVSESGRKTAIAGTAPEGETNGCRQSGYDDGQGESRGHMQPGAQCHFQSYEYQNEGYSRLQIDELVQHAGKDEKHRAQAENCEDVRAVYQKRVAGDG